MRILRATIICCAILLILAYSLPVLDDTVEYDLIFENNPVNFTGKEVKAMTINGSINCLCYVAFYIIKSS